MYNQCKETGRVGVSRIGRTLILFLLILIPILGGCATATTSGQQQDITVAPEFTVFSLGVRNDPVFIQEVLDTFIQNQGGYVFPRIISKNISHLYMRLLPSGNMEISADITLSQWFLDLLFGSLLPKQVTTGGVPFYEFSGSVIMVKPAGIVMLPLRDFLHPLYSYTEPSRAYTHDRYVNLESGLTGSLADPIEKSQSISYHVTRVGRKRYQVEGFAEFETVAAARSSVTSLRLKLAKDFSKRLSEGVFLDGTHVRINHEELTRQEAIDLIFYIGNM